MRLKPFIILLFISAGIFSCGTKKTAISSAKDLALKKVIAKHQKAAPDFESLRGRLRAGYTTEDQSQSISISIRMKKDSAIWLSAKIAGLIPLAKALVTPNGVKYYEKISKTYFSGDFRLLSDWLGTKLDFEKVQNLLLGQTIYDLNSKDYRLEESTIGYQFETKEDAFLTKLFLLNPKTYKAEAQQLVREAENRSVTVTYPEYQQTNGFYLPKKISIIANENGNSTKIDIEYRSLEFNVPVSFPFSIPSNYEEIRIQ